MLEIKSTTQGLLIPRMSTANRLSINPAAAGLLVYDESITSTSVVFSSPVQQACRSLPHPCITPLRLHLMNQILLI